MWHQQGQVRGAQYSSLCFWKKQFVECASNTVKSEKLESSSVRKKWNIAGSGNYSIYSTRRVIWTLSFCAKVPFRPVRATNNKAEESPPPHESFQSTPLTHFPPHTPPLIKRSTKVTQAKGDFVRGRTRRVGGWGEEKRGEIKTQSP